MLVNIATVSLKLQALFIKYRKDVLSRAAIPGFGVKIWAGKLRASIRLVCLNSCDLRQFISFCRNKTVRPQVRILLSTVDGVELFSLKCGKFHSNQFSGRVITRALPRFTSV